MFSFEIEEQIFESFVEEFISTSLKKKKEFFNLKN